MATLEKTAEAVEGFEGLKPADLEARRKAVAAEWTAATRGATELNEDGSFVESEASEKDRAKADVLRGQYHNIVELQAAAAPKAPEPDAADKYQGDVYDMRRGKALDAQAKRDARAFADIMKAGRNKFEAKGKLADYVQNPNEVDLGQPCIAYNSATGRNEVMPFPFVGADNSNANEETYLKNLEASFRNAEIIQADKEGLYDPKTGMKVDGHNAPVGRERVEASTEMSTDINLTTIGGGLYAEMVRVDSFMSVVKIMQSPNLNVYKMTGRTGIPTAAAVAEDGEIQEPAGQTWRPIDITPRKYGGIIQYTYETTRYQEPWSMAAQLASDLGLAVANGFNRDLLVGAAGGNTLDGFITTIKATAAYRFAGVPNAGFLRGTNTVGVDDLASFFANGIPKEYRRQPSKRVVMSQLVYSRLAGLVDGDQRRLLRDSSTSMDDLQLTEYNVRIVLDDNMDPGEASNQIPWLFGDMQSFCLLMSGGPRIDYSSEYGYQHDRLAIRVLQHCGNAIIDTKGFKGYNVS